MNIDLRNAAKNDFEKDFFKPVNNSVFGKFMVNVWKHRDIKLVTTERRSLNRPVYSALSLLHLSKIVMYEYVKPKYGEKAKLCYMDT